MESKKMFRIIRDTPAVEHDLRVALDAGIPFYALGRAAQVLAQVLGGTVEPMPSREERGETEMYRLSPAIHDPVFSQLPVVFTAYCSRIDDITILPIQCVPLVNSERTQFQAFKIAGKMVYGIQFEPSPELIEHFSTIFGGKN